MVKVEPPEDWTPPDDYYALDEAGVLRDSARLVSESTIQKPSPTSNSFDDAVDLLAGKSVPTGAPPASSAAPTPPKSDTRKPPEPKPDSTTGKTPPPLPESDWTSPASKKRLYVAGGIALALLLCVAAIGIGRALDTTDDDQQIADSQFDSTSKLDDLPLDDQASENSKPLDESREKPTSAEAENGSSEPKPADDSDSAGDDTTVAVAKPPLAPSPASESDLISPEPPTGPPGLVETPEDEPAGDSGFTAPSLLAELDKFSELIDDPTLTGGSAEGDEVADVLTPGDVPDDREPELPRPPAREVDVTARLDDPLQGIEFADVRLGAFVQFISDFSTIPISIAPGALAQRQHTPRTPVSIRQTDTTVGQVLRDVLSSLGLGYVQRDQQLVIVAVAEPDSDSPRQVEYDLSDLAAGSEDNVKMIAGWITQLIQPKSWQVNGGSGMLEIRGTSLTIRQSEAVHFETLTLCEKLRVARGLSPRSSYPTGLFRLDADAAASSPSLDQPVTMNYLDDARLVEILGRAQEQSRADILVDWHALAEEGWNPDARFLFSVDKKPLREMLARLLKQMNLVYRVVSVDTIQITTDKRLMMTPEMEFYHVGDLLSEDMSATELVEDVKSTVGEVHFFDHAGAICFDPKSRYLIVSLPPSQQQATARILESLRESESDSRE